MDATAAEVRARLLHADPWRSGSMHLVYVHGAGRLSQRDPQRYAPCWKPGGRLRAIPDLFRDAHRACGRDSAAGRASRALSPPGPRVRRSGAMRSPDTRPHGGTSLRASRAASPWDRRKSNRPHATRSTPRRGITGRPAFLCRTRRRGTRSVRGATRRARAADHARGPHRFADRAIGRAPQLGEPAHA